MLLGATKTDNDFAPFSAVKYPLHYDAVRMTTDQLHTFEQSMRFHEQMSTHTQQSSSSFLLSAKTIASLYEAQMKKFREESEERLFADYSSLPSLREDWERIKEMQRSKTDHNAHAIALTELRTLHTFRSYSQCYSRHALMLDELLHEYSAIISTNTALPAFVKSAWMSFYFCQINDISTFAEVEPATLLLINWVLQQHGVPFLVSGPLPSKVLHGAGSDVDNSSQLIAQEWLLLHLTTVCSEFDERLNNALTPPVAEPVDPDKIVTAHRKKLHESEVCFICFDDSVKCTVSLLCCGQASHSRCLQQWHDSQRGDNRGSAVGGAGSCPGCRQRCVEPVIARGGGQGETPMRVIDETFEEFVHYDLEDILCVHCSRQRRAINCNNDCCGRCCGARGFEYDCPRHENVMERNFFYWSTRYV